MKIKKNRDEFRGSIQSRRKPRGSHRFEVKLVGQRLELVPIQNFSALKGKYRKRLKTPWAVLEEEAEKFVRSNKR